MKVREENIYQIGGSGRRAAEYMIGRLTKKPGATEGSESEQ